jgi:hypothetical protein
VSYGRRTNTGGKPWKKGNLHNQQLERNPVELS